jgi:hypothetical protein
MDHTWDTPDIANKKWSYYGDEARRGDYFRYDVDWTWNDSFGFNQVFSFSFTVTLICEVLSTSGTERTT